MWRVGIPVVVATASASLVLGIILAQTRINDLQDTIQGIQDGLMVLFLQPSGKSVQGSNPSDHPDRVPLEAWGTTGRSGVKEDIDGGGCINRDVDNDCQVWADDGECERNPMWMISNCPTACGMCGKVGGCENIFEKCSSWADKGECDRNSVWMFFNCPMACQKCGVVYNGR